MFGTHYCDGVKPGCYGTTSGLRCTSSPVARSQLQSPRGFRHFVGGHTLNFKVALIREVMRFQFIGSQTEAECGSPFLKNLLGNSMIQARIDLAATANYPAFDIGKLWDSETRRDASVAVLAGDH